MSVYILSLCLTPDFDHVKKEIVYREKIHEGFNLKKWKRICLV
jgi:hypothetical protein